MAHDTTTGLDTGADGATGPVDVPAPPARATLPAQIEGVDIQPGRCHLVADVFVPP